MKFLIIFGVILNVQSIDGFYRTYANERLGCSVIVNGQSFHFYDWRHKTCLEITDEIKRKLEIIEFGPDEKNN